LTNNIILRKIHEDKRGGIAEIQFHDRAYEFFEIVKGAARGGHSHTVDTTLILLYGKLRYSEMQVGDPPIEKQMILEFGDSHKIRADVPHLVIGLENSLALEFRHEGKYENTNYAPYRKIVEDYLASED
jgi:hypothetical protein